MAETIMTIKEVAEFLKLNEKTAYRLVSHGKIPCFKVGGTWRFHRKKLEKWQKTVHIHSKARQVEKTRNNA
ncbi:MAG: helix-turn-helix domain-containing protein [Candidatus Berkiella sp.]